MASRVLVDFHHSSLLRSFYLTFEERLHHMVYRPIGMDWFEQGFWAINDSPDTAAQYLKPEGPANTDNTPKLNELTRSRNETLGETVENGFYNCYDPGDNSFNRGITLEAFKSIRFDYVIASLPAHIPLFKRLIELYQPHAKLIVQLGNEWNIEHFQGLNVMASLKPRPVHGVNVHFYHQEFDTEIFRPTVAEPTGKIYSFVNILQNHTLAWSDFSGLEHMLGRKGFTFSSYGGQCRDGNANGAFELADKMREAMMIFHVKEGGDGFGHIIYNAYAVGRPVIIRSHFYANKLAEELFVPGTFIDLDKMSLADAMNRINRLRFDPEQLANMSRRTAERFREVVDYPQEAEALRLWLSRL